MIGAHTIPADLSKKEDVDQVDGADWFTRCRHLFGGCRIIRLSHMKRLMKRYIA